ncbi:hypothetical protein ACN28C_04435 [Plantactinospora sp. WMMC1484]|uniref:hypothetical protein n=1 Tax=Plantactinospora sp. WMMC1484 TaxID=3404122 RepID=UPI003BF5726D
MNAPYPILECRPLNPAEKARWFGRRSRRAEELPRPSAHQSLVYRVAGELIVDDDRMSPADERIVNATNVSVVDMRRDALVVVSLAIPSADASCFEVLVTFRCTVNDPVAVVSGGVNAYEVLQGHLKAHSRIFELGLDYKLTEVNEVRRMVSAQVRAYLTHVPARVSGMQVRFASVEVSSPKALVDFEDGVRKSAFAHKLDWQELEYLHRKEMSTAAHSQSLESGRRDHELDLDGRSHTHDLRKTSATSAQELELDDWKHAQGLRKASADAEHELDLLQRRGEVARHEFGKNVEMINGDPKRALLAAYAAGQLDAQGLSAGLKAIDDSAREQAVQDALQNRETQLALRAASREERKVERDWQREEDERRAEREQRRETQDRVDRLRREKEAREDRLHNERVQREQAQRLDSMRFEMLKTMTAQGQFNTVDLGGSSLFAEVMHMPQPEVDRQRAAAVAGPTAQEEIESGEDRSGGVREEDE